MRGTGEFFTYPIKQGHAHGIFNGRETEWN